MTGTGGGAGSSVTGTGGGAGSVTTGTGGAAGSSVTGVGGAAGSGGYRALLAVPVESPRDEGGGMVAVLFAEERALSDEDLELARHLADATRGALERSELFEAERSARALAQQLTRTGRLLTTELDPAAVLDEVVQQAPELVNADACAIRVLEDDELVVNAAVGLSADALVGTRVAASSLLSGDVLQSRAPVVLEDAASDPRMRASPATCRCTAMRTREDRPGAASPPPGGSPRALCRWPCPPPCPP